MLVGPFARNKTKPSVPVVEVNAPIVPLDVLELLRFGRLASWVRLRLSKRPKGSSIRTLWPNDPKVEGT